MKLFTRQKEIARLNEVSIYKNLQDLKTEQLQKLVNIASSYFSVPIVYISLIDEFKQVLMAKKGITLDEMRKEDTFCHHVINKGTPLIINDTTKDSNFKSNPLVEYYPHIRFYAGAPFISKNGFILGAFCICDTRFRTFSFKEEEKLVAFSKIASEIIETIQTEENSTRPVFSVWNAKSEFSNLIKKQITIPNNSPITRMNESKNNFHSIYRESSNKFSAIKSTDMLLVPHHSTAITVPRKSNLYQWGEMMIGSHKRNASEISFSALANGVFAELDSSMKSKGNKIEWDITEPGGWYGDETAIKFVCNNILQNVNGRNNNSTIRINTFNDEDYAIMVIRHEGAPIVRSELDDAYKSSPNMIDSRNKEDLYFTWHTLKLISGFITVPESTREGNYITVAFPKKTIK